MQCGVNKLAKEKADFDAYKLLNSASKIAIFEA